MLVLFAIQYASTVILYEFAIVLLYEFLPYGMLASTVITNYNE